ncbi:MAG TPA: SH3 domain-containing protein [Candidatus Paceibacterota bacterium]|nr:SH3 domain-containing protein [Candidatus Paceibacterota bacterium]
MSNAQTTFTEGVKVQATSPLKVRSTPGGTRVDTVDEGTSGTIVDGPQVVGDYTWWKIDYSTGVTGWSADAYLIVSPSVAVPAPAPVTASKSQMIDTLSSMSVVQQSQLANALSSMSSVQLEQLISYLKTKLGSLNQ